MNEEQDRQTNPTARRLGRQLAELRRAAGLSQRQFAELCGVVHSQIYNAESGAFDTQVGKLERLLNALNYELTIQPRGNVKEPTTARPTSHME